MIRTTPLWRSIAVVGVASLALAACGGDDEGDGTAADESPTAELTGDGELVLGTLLPQTGSLAFLGPPEFAGVDLGCPGDQRGRWRPRPGRRGQPHRLR